SFFTLRPPPISTPFPYTTLFRSDALVVRHDGPGMRVADEAVVCRLRVVRRPLPAVPDRVLSLAQCLHIGTQPVLVVLVAGRVVDAVVLLVKHRQLQPAAVVLNDLPRQCPCLHHPQLPP